MTEPRVEAGDKKRQALLIAGLLKWQHRVLFGQRKEFESDKTVESIDYLIGMVVDGQI